MSEQPKSKNLKGPIARIDSDAAEVAFRMLMNSVVPDNSSLRSSFKKCMPYLYVLRNKGSSWDQLTTLLNQVGIKLLSSTVRSYYYEMLEERMDKCQEAMNDYLLSNSKAKKMAESEEEEERVAALYALNVKRRRAAAEKLGVKYVGPDYQEKLKEEYPKIGFEKKEKMPLAVDFGAGQSPAPAPKEVGGYGLLNGTSNKAIASGNGKPDGGFFNFGADNNSVAGNGFEKNVEAPPAAGGGEKKIAAPPLSSQNQTNTSTNSDVCWKCLPLQPNAGQLERREGVPEIFYQNGLLEHPAIAGLFLTLEERLYKATLEIAHTQSGEIRFEGFKERTFRVLWKKPIPVSPSRTSKDFIRDYSNPYVRKNPGVL